MTLRFAMLVSLWLLAAFSALSAEASVKAQAADGLPGQIISGSIPADGGFGLVVFSGGSFDQLVAASGCPLSRAVFWFTVDGDFVIFVPGTRVAVVNAGAEFAFPNRTIPASTALIGRCRRLPVIALDPGHGGDDPGAVANGVVERDSNLDIALRVEAILARENYEVVLTRRTAERPQLIATQPDVTGATATFLDLQDRISIVNSARADVFIAIHSNAWTDPDERGLQVWFDAQRPFAQSNRALADSLAGQVEAALHGIDAGVPVTESIVRNDAELIDSAGHVTPLFVLGSERELFRDEIVARGIDPEAIGFAPAQPSIRTNATQMPGALIELLFLSNNADATLLRDDRARQQMAQGIASGIVGFLLAAPLQ